jgi:hypothetical protein
MDTKKITHVYVETVEITKNQGKETDNTGYSDAKGV